MTLLIGFLTFILVVDCLFLMLLVLVQLPKKEAGSGLAFGAGTVDTLIGAGSGNALTKLTKYSAGAFLGLALVLAVLNAQRHGSSSRNLQEELSKKASAVQVLPTTPAPAPASGPLNAALPTNSAAAPAVTPPQQTTSTQAAPAFNLTPLPDGEPQPVQPAVPPAQNTPVPAQTQPEAGATTPESNAQPGSAQ